MWPLFPTFPHPTPTPEKNQPQKTRSPQHSYSTKRSIFVVVCFLFLIFFLEDDRSVDDLLSFINSNQPQKKKKKNQANKKNDEQQETERKVESKSPPPLAPPQQDNEDDEPEIVVQPQIKPAVRFNNAQFNNAKPRIQTQIDREQSELFLTRLIEMDPHSNEFQEMFEEEEKSIDPEFKAMVDREVEEWQKKLDQIYGGNLQNEIF